MFKRILAATVLVAGFAGVAQADGHTTSDVLQSGTFEGRSDHVTTGGVTILKTASGFIAVLESDFDLDGAPDPTLGFGAGGTFDEATQFTELREDKGLQVYAIPANVNPADFDEFYVWCREFSVPLGVAKFSK